MENNKDVLILLALISPFFDATKTLQLAPEFSASLCNTNDETEIRVVVHCTYSVNCQIREY